MKCMTMIRSRPKPWMVPLLVLITYMLTVICAQVVGADGLGGWFLTEKLIERSGTSNSQIVVGREGITTSQLDICTEDDIFKLISREAYNFLHPLAVFIWILVCASLILLVLSIQQPIVAVLLAAIMVYLSSIGVEAILGAIRNVWGS